MRDASKPQSRLDPSVLQTWYFTFGQAHRFPSGYFVVREATYSQARERMFDTFGREWAFQYDETDWHKHGISIAEKWDLVEIA